MKRTAILVLFNVFFLVLRSDGQKATSIKDVRYGLEKFSLELILRTAIKQPDASFVLSPYSTWSTMSVLAEGARAHTLDEMRKALKHPAQDGEVRREYADVARSLRLNSSRVQIDSVNAIFVDFKKALLPEYEAIVRESYGTQINKVDFANSRTLSIINNLIKESTKGRIENIVQPADLVNAQAIVTNAVFFKGEWRFPFNTTMTKLENFYDEKGESVGQVNMMKARAPFPYVNMKEFQSYIVELGYGEDSPLSMLLMLPYDRVPLSDIYQKFLKIQIAEIFKAIEDAQQYDDEEVDVYLPRFAIKTDLVMNQLLNDMNMFEAFDSVHADFSGMTKNSLFLSKVIQKANIEVNEEGTVASAATAAELVNKNTPPKFVANKPFLFLIVEKVTKIIVFGGVYRVPEVV